MRPGRTTRFTMALAFCGVTACSILIAADSKPAEAKPQAIEFSRPSSTTKAPKPGSKNEDALKRFGNVPEAGIPSTGPSELAPSLSTAPVLPSRASQEKMRQEMDRKRNWLVPGAQEIGTSELDKENGIEKENWQGLDKKESVMERYFNGKEGKDPRNREGRERAGAPERDDRSGVDSKDFDSNTKNDDLNREEGRDVRSNKESNDLAEFDLKNFIRAQNSQSEFLKDNQLPKASKLFKSDLGNASAARQADRERSQVRDRNTAHSAEFMQLLKPRSSGSIAGVSDPLNAPDLTRREMIPVLPRMNENSESRSAFPTPASPAARIQDNSMFGVTGPAASSMSPIVNIPTARPEVNPTRSSIIHEAPKRPF